MKKTAKTSFRTDSSAAQRTFLSKYRLHKRIVTAARILLLVVFLSVWELAASYQIIDSFIFSSPSKIVRCFLGMTADRSIFLHLGVTLYETIVSFLLVTLFSILTAVLLWFSKKLSEILEPYLVVLNSLPKIALGPLIIIWFGSGRTAIVVMAVLITVIVTVITMLAGFVSTDENKLLLMKTFGANKLQILLKLVLPANVPTFISMLKISVGMAWIGSIMGEYLVSRAGLGYLIVYGGQVFKLDLVMAATVVLCLLAAIMYSAVALLEKKIVKYKDR